jgi:CubicO group peptidase (beta-lactamase class C family)
LSLSNVTENEVVDTFIDMPLQFEPGSDWSYSNSGYHLLGDIIAEVAGTRYRTYLRDTFFDPLGMENTDLERNTRVINRRAEGYISRTTRADYLNMNVPYSAGALISTVDDLFIWQRALVTGLIVREETLDQMWERAINIDSRTKYGYGLFREIQRGQDVISHGGGINGFTSMLSYLPEHDLTLIVLTNRQNPAVGVASGLIFSGLVGVAETTSP